MHIYCFKFQSNEDFDHDELKVKAQTLNSALNQLARSEHSGRLIVSAFKHGTAGASGGIIKLNELAGRFFPKVIKTMEKKSENSEFDFVKTIKPKAYN